jgi:hypothetical protein
LATPEESAVASRASDSDGTKVEAQTERLAGVGSELLAFFRRIDSAEPNAMPSVRDRDRLLRNASETQRDLKRKRDSG